MAEQGARIASADALRFRPANSNDRTRAGIEHAFRDVPPCAFTGDDGISPYLDAASSISGYPDTAAKEPAQPSAVPDIAPSPDAPARMPGLKLLRSGFAVSVFLHFVAAVAAGLLTAVRLPDAAMLEGETVVAVELFSETDSDVTTRARQVEQDGEDEAAEETRTEPSAETPERETRKDVATAAEKENPAASQPEKLGQPIVGAETPEILSTNEPSAFQIEAAGRQIVENTSIEPLPEIPAGLITPVEAKKPDVEAKAVASLPHPVSKPRDAEVKPVAKPVEDRVRQQVARPKKTDTADAKRPEPRPAKPKKKSKKTLAQDGNADFASDKGSSEAKRRDGESQDASDGNSTKKVKGNAALSNYKGIVERKLARAKKRTKPGAKGDVVVAFTISANGSVVKLAVRRSSGKPAVDRAALDVVRKAAPFPPLPPESGLKTYPTTLRLTFK